jgi:uncharacterized membrane protein
MRAPTGTVRALAAGSHRHYVLIRVREWVRDRFWVVPALLLAAGVVLAVLTAAADDFVPASWRQGLPIDSGAADGILGIIAASMLTFVGVVFTITLVALQLASAQLSPRVLRTFVRSAVTKLAFGTFLATFAFSFTVLVLDEALATEEARERAVTAGALLVLASLGIFVVYVTATMRLLQVSWVVTAVADETRAAIRVNLPPAGDYRDAPSPALVADPVPVRLPGEEGGTWPGEFGVVLSVNRARLVRLAREHGCVLELLPRIGDYVPTGAPLLGVHGGNPPPARDLVASVQLGRDRTVFQDPAYGLRQLVDVATQALSPALNQPTTAVHVLDRLEDLLLRAAWRPEPTGLWLDEAGTVRLVERPVRWAELLDLAVEEIIGYGSDSSQVVRRLLVLLERIAAEVPAERAAPVRRWHAEIAAIAAAGWTGGGGLDGDRPLSARAAPTRPVSGDRGPGQEAGGRPQP